MIFIFKNCSDDNLLDYVSSTTVGHAIGRAVMACEGLYEPTGCQAKAIQASFADLSGIVLKVSEFFYDFFKRDLINLLTKKMLFLGIIKKISTFFRQA